MFTTPPDASTGALQAWAKTNGIAKLAVRKDIRAIDALPVLGTGKLEYVKMSAMVAGL